MVMAGIINSACTATRYDNVGRILEEKNYSKFVNSSGTGQVRTLKYYLIYRMILPFCTKAVSARYFCSTLIAFSLREE
jgi:hypothetical protein